MRVPTGLGMQLMGGVLANCVQGSSLILQHLGVLCGERVTLGVCFTESFTRESKGSVHLFSRGRKATNKISLNLIFVLFSF